MKLFPIAAAAVLLAALPMTSAAEDAAQKTAVVNGVTYIYTADASGKSAVISRAEIPDKAVDVTIPSEIDGAQVVGIANYAFQGSLNAESIVIPDSIKFMGTGAFMSCTSLKKVVIGSGISVISADCFFACPNLTTVELPDTLQTIGYESFFCCPDLDMTIPESVKEIGENALGFEADPHSGQTTPVLGFLIKGTKGSFAEQYAESVGIDFIDMNDYLAGDVDGDEMISPHDASVTLYEYVLASTGEPREFTRKQMIVSDMNKNDEIDPLDASEILSLYAYLSTQRFDE